MSKRVKILIPAVSDEMIAAIEKHAAAENISRTHVIVEALTDRYGLKQPEVRPTYRPQDGERPEILSVEVPERIRTKLRLEAAQKGATISGIVRATVAEKLGLPEEDMHRRPRSRTA